MLTVILKILSIAGIILLVLLGVVLFAAVLILFVPISYNISAEKSDEKIEANVRAGWLFGLIRAFFAYPEPGGLIVKILFFKVFDTGKIEKKANTARKEVNKEANSPQSGKDASNAKDTEGAAVNNKSNKETKKSSDESAYETSKEAINEHDESINGEKKNIFEKLFAKYEKIRYTIKDIYDKIKDIFKEIDFYKDLLAEDETKDLLRHAFLRLGKVLKSIRPKKILADIVFGAASPDVTGYVCALYGMASPRLGRKFYFTPDFTKQVLLGEIHVKGHITIFIILLNGIILLLDRKLKRLKKKLDKHTKKKNKQNKQSCAEGTGME